jgi:hypothetical protein
MLPQAETCQNTGSDDDCNDLTDDVPGLGAPCIDDTQKGICRDGTTQCTSSAPAPVCVTMQPMHELCDAIDQDCDGDPYNGYDLNSDRNNCGMCGNACSPDAICCGGMCLPVKDLYDDPKNCGMCGHVCGDGQYCCQGDCLNDPSGGGGGIILPPRGACACTQDCGKDSCCGTTCVDLLNDPNNCGGCGVACGTIGTCCNGHCSKLCAVGL